MKVTTVEITRERGSDSSYLTVSGEGFYRTFRVSAEQLEIPGDQLNDLVAELLALPPLRTKIDRS